MDVEEIQLTDEEAEALMGAGGRFPPQLVSTLRASLLRALPKDMPEDERKEAEKKLESILAEIGDKPPARYAMDSLLDLLRRSLKRMEDLPSLVLGMTKMLGARGISAPHVFRLGAVYEQLTLVSFLLENAEKELGELSGCSCFTGIENEAENEKAASS